jgi:phage terminase large subunit
MATLAQTPVKTGLSITGNVDFPRKMQPLFRPKRYKIIPGGRGGAKSWSIARALLLICAKKKTRVLCGRETQVSITESVHKLLKDQIDALGLKSIYDVQKTVIRCRRTGSDFIFVGIKNDPDKLKSTEGVDICWVEEAHKVSEESWKILIPTIRKDGSEIWISFNPDQETDPTSKRFLLNPPIDSVTIEANWQDNPWFPETLRKEKDYDYRVDPESAAHVWGGKFRKGSQAQIFGPRKYPDGTTQPVYVVEEFTPFIKAQDGKTDILKPGWTGPYFGGDWGFSPDPITLVKCWLDRTKVYVEREAYAVAIEVPEIAALYASIPGANDHVIRADNARPELISYMANVCSVCGVHADAHQNQKHSFVPYNIIPAEKWPGSVEDGIGWLRGHEQIVIHPRCLHTEEEARLYRKKTDPITGDVLPIIIDKHNHCWDSIRYAFQPMIKTPESEDTMVYEEQISISPELDEFDLRYGR